MKHGKSAGGSIRTFRAFCLYPTLTHVGLGGICILCIRCVCVCVCARARVRVRGWVGVRAGVKGLIGDRGQPCTQHKIVCAIMRPTHIRGIHFRARVVAGNSSKHGDAAMCAATYECDNNRLGL